MSGVMGYIAPNSAEEDVLDFEKLPDERYFTQNNTRMSTFNSLKHGNYHRFLECDLNETYSRLSEHTGGEMMDIEILRNLLIEKDSYVPPRLEFHFDLRGPLDGPTVDREELGHSNDSLVWSILFQDKTKFKILWKRILKRLCYNLLFVFLSIYAIGCLCFV